MDPARALRIPLLVGLAGAIVGLAASIWHPVPPDDKGDELLARLRQVAESDTWVAGHTALIASILLIFVGGSALLHWLPDGFTRRLSSSMLAISTSVALATVALDGFSLARVADRVVADGNEAGSVPYYAAFAVDETALPFFSLLILVYFGLHQLLIGAAWTTGTRVPRLGWVAVVAGTIGVVGGFCQLLNTEPTGFTIFAFIASSIVFFLWHGATCLLLLARGGSRAGAAADAGA